jgi:hypothetical protein
MKNLCFIFTFILCFVSSTSVNAQFKKNFVLPVDGVVKQLVAQETVEKVKIKVKPQLKTNLFVIQNNLGNFVSKNIGKSCTDQCPMDVNNLDSSDFNNDKIEVYKVKVKDDINQEKSTIIKPIIVTEVDNEPSSFCDTSNSVKKKENYFKENCSQLAGGILIDDENNTFKLGSLLLNSSKEVFNIEAQPAVCDKCFRNNINNNKFKQEQLEIAKGLVKKLNEQRLEREVFKLASIMENSMKLNAIRGASIRESLKKKYNNDSKKIKLETDRIACKGSSELAKEVALLCPGKALEINALLKRVSPVGIDASNPIKELIDNLYSNVEKLKVDENECLSKMKSIKNFQQAMFFAGNNSNPTLQREAHSSMNSFFNEVTKNETFVKDICTTHKPGFFLLIQDKLEKALSSGGPEDQLAKSIRSYSDKFLKTKEQKLSKSIDIVKDTKFQKEIVNSFMSTAMTVDPMHKLMLNDSSYFCQFALSDNHDKGVESFLNFNSKIESEEDYDLRHYKIAKSYSEKNCKPIMNNIKNLVCGRATPNFDNSQEYKQFLTANFSAKDIKNAQKERFDDLSEQQNKSETLYDQDDIEVPALAGLVCELNNTKNENEKSVDIENLFSNGRLAPNNISSFLKRSMNIRKKDKNEELSVDEFSEYSGTHACLDSSDENLIKLKNDEIVRGKVSSASEVTDAIVNSLVDKENYEGEIPEEISRKVKRERRRKRKNRNRNIASVDSAATTKKTVGDTTNTNADEDPFESEIENSIFENQNTVATNNFKNRYQSPMSNYVDNIEKEDIDKVLGDPEQFNNYNNWKEEKENNENKLNNRIKNLNTDLSDLKSKNKSIEDNEEIRKLEEELATLDSSLKKSKSKKYAIKDDITSDKKYLEKRKAKKKKLFTEEVQNYKPTNKAKTFFDSISSMKNPIQQRSFEKRSSLNNTGYLILQDLEKTEDKNLMSSIFEDKLLGLKVGDKELGEIDVKYGANGLPAFVKIPGETLYVQVSLLSDNARELIFSKLGRNEQVKLVILKARQSNVLGVKLASLDEKTDDVITVVGLKTASYVQMLEFARSTEDSTLEKNYLNKIKNLDSSLYNSLKTINE